MNHLSKILLTKALGECIPPPRPSSVAILKGGACILTSTDLPDFASQRFYTANILISTLKFIRLWDTVGKMKSPIKSSILKYNVPYKLTSKGAGVTVAEW